MAAPAFEEIAEIIEFRLNQVVELLNEIEYELNTCTPRELYDYLTGDNFKDSEITFRDRLGNEYLFLHSIIEISGLKDAEVEINPMTIKSVSKETIYDQFFIISVCNKMIIWRYCQQWRRIIII